VVIGHVIQGSAENFDNLLGFKVIYSFYMPLFIFLSGAAAAIAFNSRDPQKELRHTALIGWQKIKKAAIQPLIPFIA